MPFFYDVPVNILVEMYIPVDFMITWTWFFDGHV